LEVEGIDRMYLNVYMADLQREQGVVWFLRHHRGHPVLQSAAALARVAAAPAGARNGSGVARPQPACLAATWSSPSILLRWRRF
jgi:hypothetical protein